MRPPLHDPHLRLLDDARHADAVSTRAGRRLLDEADGQDATFLGSLEEVAESGATVVLETSVGRRLRGRVLVLAADHVAVAGDHGTAWVRVSAVTVLRVHGEGAVRAGGGDRPERADVPLAEALRGLVEARRDVEVLFDGGSSARGTAVTVGRDVLTLRNPASGDRVLVHLARAAVVLAHAT